MSRKPYQQVQAKNWYMQNRFYKLYMLRELTALPTFFVALNLFWGLASLASSEALFNTWLNFQKHPLIIIFNLIALLAALFNSKTWFETMPKVMKIPMPNGKGFVPGKALIIGSWAVLILVFLFLLTLQYLAK